MPWQQQGGGGNNGGGPWGSGPSGGGGSGGLTATGGIISEYADPTGQKWVAHTFTAPGNFDITAKGSYPLAVDYFLFDGGGGGGGGHGGGGGAGGVETGTDLPVDIATYAVTVGAGGRAGAEYTHPSSRGTVGGNSTLAYNGGTKTAGGGGYGGGYNQPTGNPSDGGPGGSGGGAAGQAPSAGSGGAASGTGTGFAGGAAPGSAGGGEWRTSQEW